MSFALCFKMADATRTQMYCRTGSALSGGSPSFLRRLEPHHLTSREPQDLIGLDTFVRDGGNQRRECLHLFVPKVAVVNADNAPALSNCV